jgi:hypothetical protein
LQRRTAPMPGAVASTLGDGLELRMEDAQLVQSVEA